MLLNFGDQRHGVGARGDPDVSHEDGPYGVGEAGERFAKAKGFQVVKREAYSASAPDLSSLVMIGGFVAAFIISQIIACILNRSLAQLTQEQRDVGIIAPVQDDVGLGALEFMDDVDLFLVDQRLHCIDDGVDLALGAGVDGLQFIFAADAAAFVGEIDAIGVPIAGDADRLFLGANAAKPSRVKVS